MPRARTTSPARARLIAAAAALASVLVLAVVGLSRLGADESAVAEPAAPSSPATASASPDQPDAPGAPDAPEAATPGTALALLETLPVKGRAPKTGYDREGDFGTAWFDVDRNGCDTRNDILGRDLAPVVKSGPCKVTSGTLHDPYTGTTIDFVRGNGTSMAVQIDHVVALMNAWETGAQQLTQEQRVSLANDPLNLIAVDGPTNSAKGAGDAATWLPPQKGFRCTYVARQVSVKAAYGLWVTQAEHDAIARILADCPAEPAVASGTQAVVTAAAPEPAAAPAPAPAPAPVASAPAPAGVYYANCDAVRAAGAAPIHAGDPGYSFKLDRDQDGTACE